MNKKELIDAVASEGNFSKADSERALNAVLKTITGAVNNGDDVRLLGFGSFSVTTRAARTGRNPQTGTAIKIPAKKVVKFKASSSLLT